jgi:hypothetical protein
MKTGMKTGMKTRMKNSRILMVNGLAVTAFVAKFYSHPDPSVLAR